jgi:hypothetical protein
LEALSIYSWLQLSWICLLIVADPFMIGTYLHPSQSHDQSHFMMKNWTNGRTYRASPPFILENKDVQSLWWKIDENSWWHFVTWLWPLLNHWLDLRLIHETNLCVQHQVIYHSVDLRLENLAGLLWWVFQSIHTVWFTINLIAGTWTHLQLLI